VDGEDGLEGQLALADEDGDEGGLPIVNVDDVRGGDEAAGQLDGGF